MLSGVIGPHLSSCWSINIKSMGVSEHSSPPIMPNICNTKRCSEHLLNKYMMVQLSLEVSSVNASPVSTGEGILLLNLQQWPSCWGKEPVSHVEPLSPYSLLSYVFWYRRFGLNVELPHIWQKYPQHMSHWDALIFWCRIALYFKKTSCCNIDSDHGKRLRIYAKIRWVFLYDRFSHGKKIAPFSESGFPFVSHKKCAWAQVWHSYLHI